MNPPIAPMGSTIPDSGSRILLTGASGYLGGLVAAALLREPNVRIVAPVRARRTPERVLAPIERALAGDAPPDWRARLEIVVLPEIGDVAALDAIARQAGGFDEVVHCAGCLSYFDEAALERGNPQLTRFLVERARAWGVGRFVYLSTAFSCGLVQGVVPERLHAEPPGDPTPYARSKRSAEHIVAESGVPYLILRPTAVIGDSSTGRYEGPRYGVYQLWTGLARNLFSQWHRELHYVAPRVPVHLLHQDVFQRLFVAACADLPDGSIAHLTQPSEVDARALSELWIDRCMAPERVYYYDRIEDVPLDSVHPRQRAFLALASTNIRISTRHWAFETAALERLAAHGVTVPPITLDTLGACQQAFVAGTRRIERFRERHAERFSGAHEVVEMGGGEGGAVRASEGVRA